MQRASSTFSICLIIWTALRISNERSETEIYTKSRRYSYTFATNNISCYALHFTPSVTRNLQTSVASRLACFFKTTLKDNLIPNTIWATGPDKICVKRGQSYIAVQAGRYPWQCNCEETQCNVTWLNCHDTRFQIASEQQSQVKFVVKRHCHPDAKCKRGWNRWQCKYKDTQLHCNDTRFQIVSDQQGQVKRAKGARGVLSLA